MSEPAKEKYLKIAADLVHQEVTGEPASVHLAGRARFDVVATRVGTARSAMYRMWGSQLDYWHDLVTYAVLNRMLPLRALLTTHPDSDSDTDREPTLGSSEGHARPHDLASLVELLRPRFNRAAEVLARDPKHMIRVGLVGYPRMATLSELVASADRRERQRASLRLATALRAVGRRPITPLTTLDLVTGLSFLLDGVASYGRIYPWFIERRVNLDREAHRSWSLSSLAMRAVLYELTEPGDLDEPEVPTGEDQLIEDELVERLASNVEPASTMNRAPDWSPAQIKALKAGIEIIGEPNPASGVVGADMVLGHVTLARVARAAGVTRRHMYHLWPSQADFRLDLIDYLVQPDRAEFLGRFADAAEVLAHAEQGRFVLELVDAINAHRRHDNEPQFDVSWALHPVLAEPDLAEWRRASHHERLREFSGLVAVLAQEWEATPLDGLSPQDISGLNLMGSSGTERLHIADPHALRYDIPWRGGHYSLYAIVNQALMEHVLVRPPASADRPGEPGS